MTPQLLPVGLYATGRTEFLESVRAALQSLVPTLDIGPVHASAVALIDGGDSPAETILAAIPPTASIVVCATNIETCAAVTAAGVAAVVCHAGEELSRENVVEVGGSSIVEGLRSSGENHAERRIAKILSRMARGLTLPRKSPIGWPMEAMVEVVRTCNLRCPLCPVGNRAAEHYENMPLETFREIAAVLGETVTSLSLYNYGEPLLHPRIDEIVAAAKSAAIESVTITTNGTILRAGLEEALVSAGLDSLRVSIDGATQESYEKYRVGGDLGKVWRNVRRFVAAKRRLGSVLPRIEAQFVVNRWNEHEMERFRALAEDAGVDRVRFKTFNALMTGPEQSDVGREFLPADARHSRYADSASLVHRDRYKLAQCDWPLIRVVVNADGTVVPCCYDYNGRHRLGTFRGGTASAGWWQTTQRARFRERLRTDPMSIDICSICPMGVPKLDVAFD